MTKPTIQECLSNIKFVNRFLKKFDIPDNYAEECWLWKLTLQKNGYGKLSISMSESHLAHRISYEYYKEPIPEGLVVDHLCRNRGCINPWHLEAVTIGENVLRGETVASANNIKTHCKNGHELAEDNLMENPKHRQCKTCRRFWDSWAFKHKGATAPWELSD